MSAETTSISRRVLVVDDDPAMLATLAEALELAGDFEVIVASDGASGLERFFSVQPDCVVVDVRHQGTHEEVLGNPEISHLYLGGTISGGAVTGAPQTTTS